MKFSIQFITFQGHLLKSKMNMTLRMKITTQLYKSLKRCKTEVGKTKSLKASCDLNLLFSLLILCYVSAF